MYVCSEVGDHAKQPDRSLLHLKEVVSLLPPHAAPAVSRVGQKAVCAAEAQPVILEASLQEAMLVAIQSFPGLPNRLMEPDLCWLTPAFRRYL